VAQLLALDGGGGDGADRLDRLRRVAGALGARAAGSQVDRETVDAWLRAMLDRGMSHRDRLSEADLAGYLEPFAGADGVERFARVLESFDGEGLVGLEPRLAELEIPTLVLWGEVDTFVPADVAERLGDALPMATIALLPDCGHFLLEDAAETALPLVFQYLRSRYLGTRTCTRRGP
jgi:pimeloyl-ACP methyl ester carboxylesterase